MTESEIVAPDGAISVGAAIDIRAPCEQGIATYLDVEHWDRTFSGTIRGARLIRDTERVKEILVDHKVEGRVPNRLTLSSAGRIWLEERKKRFDATFLNEFAAIRNGAATRYTVMMAVVIETY